jgi:hypothetical protein
VTVINGTSGVDTIEIIGDAGTLNGSSQGGPISGIDSNGGYDTITVSNSTVSGEIDGGSGGMDLSVIGSTIGTIATRTGASNITTSNSSINQINTGGGDVTMDTTNTDINVIDTSSGDFTLNMTGGTFSGTYNGGGGADNLTFTNVTINDFISFDGGSGDDTFTFDDTTIGDNFFFQVGSGNDTVNILGDTSFGNNAVIDASTLGNNHINLPDGTSLTVDGMGTYTVGTDTLPSGTNLNGSFTLPNGSGASFDDFESFGSTGAPVCFTEGTLILTPAGEVVVDDLAVGDLLVNAQGEALPIRWIGEREMIFTPAQAKHRPVQIKAGALSSGVPARDLAVSPQHCLLVQGPDVVRHFGLPCVFVRAKMLTIFPGVRVMTGKKRTRYFTLLLDHHLIIRANGAWTESFYPGPMGVRMLNARQRADIEAIFPALREDPDGGYTPRAARVLTRGETELLKAATGENKCRKKRKYAPCVRVSAFDDFGEPDKRLLH